MISETGFEGIDEVLNGESLEGRSVTVESFKKMEDKVLAEKIFIFN